MVSPVPVKAPLSSHRAPEPLTSSLVIVTATSDPVPNGSGIVVVKGPLSFLDGATKPDHPVMVGPAPSSWLPLMSSIRAAWAVPVRTNRKAADRIIPIRIVRILPLLQLMRHGTIVRNHLLHCL